VRQVATGAHQVAQHRAETELKMIKQLSLKQVSVRLVIHGVDATK